MRNFIRLFRPVRLFRWVLAVFLALGITGAALKTTEAQTGPETIWEEGRQVVVGGNETDAISILAVPTTPGTHYRSYSGTSFQPTASSMTYAPIGGAIYVTALPAGGYSLSHELLLPQGATITEVVFYIEDSNAADISVSLRSFAPDTNAFLILESGTSTGSSAAIQAIILPVNPPVVVNNTATSYRLRVAPGVATSDHLLYGARVGYTVPTNFLPLIER